MKPFEKRKIYLGKIYFSSLIRTLTYLHFVDDLFRFFSNIFSLTYNLNFKHSLAGND